MDREMKLCNRCRKKVNYHRYIYLHELLCIDCFKKRLIYSLANVITLDKSKKKYTESQIRRYLFGWVWIEENIMKRVEKKEE